MLTKKAAAGIAGAGTMLAVTGLLATHAMSAAAPADLAGGTSKYISVPALAHDPSYTDTVEFQAVGHASDKPVTATSGTPHVCVADLGTQVVHMIHAGMCIVVFHQAAASGAEVASMQVMYQVHPVDLTIRVKNATKAADQPNPVWDITYDGLINGDDPSDLPPVLVTTTQQPGDNALELSGGNDPDYHVTYVNGTMTINPVLKAVGLPADAEGALVVDGSAIMANRIVLPVGTAMGYTFKPVYRWGGEVYITTAQGSAGPIRDSATARYATMPALIDAATADDAVTASLKSQWATVLDSTGPTRGANLAAFANDVRNQDGRHDLSVEGQAAVLEYAQVYYGFYGYSGTV